MKFWKQIFYDNNHINEKSILGFAAFVVMTVFAVADIISAYTGKELLVNEFIFNSFLILTLGSFGISSVDKFINSKKETTDDEIIDIEDETTPEPEPKYKNKVEDDVIN